MDALRWLLAPCGCDEVPLATLALLLALPVPGSTLTRAGILAR